MQFLKLSFLVLFSISLFAQDGQKFSSQECLDASYDTTIKSEGKFFGLMKNDLYIKKTKCIIQIKYKGILESVWDIDLCREPIHMKVTSKGSQNVFKREEECTENSTSDFCYYLKELKTNISDYGLIFAKGLREKLSDPHGQIYCISLLVNKYFDQEVVFSLFDKPVDLYSNKNDGCIAAEDTTKTSSTQGQSNKIPQVGNGLEESQLSTQESQRPYKTENETEDKF